MKLSYRPEIDGLRTIAVLSVMIYHAEFLWGQGIVLPGGFLGVDIFFVISGYLITSIIWGELHSSGRLSISNFYERRARRLLPTLLAVMLTSIPVAWHYLAPAQLLDYCLSLVSTLFFGSNFYWHLGMQQYGVESALLKPFLHTWSLAIEEQYYIAFPLILLAFYRYCKQYVSVILGIALLLSLLFAQYMTPQNPSFSFYMLPSRFWELLAGSLLAIVLFVRPAQTKSALLSNTMPAIGLVMIIYSLLTTKYEGSHPGIVTLPPILGTVLIIWFSYKENWTTRFLASKPMVWIGLISYSLYLWHYPIFAFGRLSDFSVSAQDKALWFALTFLLSILTYFGLERPFREKEKLL